MQGCPLPGFGLALPFVLLVWFPAATARLPRPGPWMTHFRQLLAFPMYAAAIWLVWVLTLQTGASGVVLAAQNATAFKRVQQLANEHGLPITHGPDRWLEQRLISQGAAVLPLLILLDGHATQEPTP